MEKAKTAFDIQYNEKTKNYELIIVGYNLDTKEGLVLSVESFADAVHTAIFKSKEILVKKILNLK